MSLAVVQSKSLYVPVSSDASLPFVETNVGFSVRYLSQEDFFDYFFRNYQGFVCVFQKIDADRKGNERRRQMFFRNNDSDRERMFRTLSYYGWDTYVSYSTYYRGRKRDKADVLRTQENIVCTHMLVQDLDYYKFNISDAQALQFIGKWIAEGSIIAPNIIISTGRGLQLLWKIAPIKMKKGTPTDIDWHAIQSHMKNLLQSLNSDNVVKNPSAVTRVPETKHRKSGNKVYAYQVSDSELTLLDFIDFYDLVPSTDRKVKPKKSVASKSTVAHLVSSWNEFTLNRERENDIFRFVEERNRRNEPYYAKRNWLALVLRFHALVSSDGDINYAEQRVKELCTILDLADTSEEEILRRSKPAERFYEEWQNDTWNRERYTQGGLFYSNRRLLELMGIQDDYEMQVKLKTIKIRNKAYEAAKKRLEREAKGMGTIDQYHARRVAEKESKLQQLRIAMETHPHATRRQLADLLGITPPRVTQLKKELLGG
ncbi:hypothetical protein [Aneurinibacillus danicus]|uniref:Replication protein n=1 Tax=Aneurinibacillus danicus TaxID=267746 RepID=A0A511VC71_9BACL|nr:hypothetical protein [Aneurinibacillus danicus]GEN35951.1 hypothetical protein ADA01nite_34110 [Aneurinibacillus danicus]